MFDPSTGQELQRLSTHTEAMVISLACSPDGRTLAAGTVGAGLRLFSLPTGGPIGIIDIYPTERCLVTAVAFAADSETCAAALHVTRDGSIGTMGNPDLYEIALWSLSDEQPDPSTLLGHAGWIAGLRFSPAADLLVSSGFDERVVAWDPHFHELRAESKEHEGRVYALDLSPDGTRFATASADRTVRVWETAAIDHSQDDPTNNSVISAELMLSQLLLYSETGRDAFLVLAQDVADELLRLNSPRDMTSAVNRFVDIALSYSLTKLGVAVTQVLTIRHEQARRTQDEVTASSCSQLLSLINQGLAGYVTGLTVIHNEKGAPDIDFDISFLTPSPAEPRLTEVVMAVSDGIVSSDQARLEIEALEITPADLTFAFSRLHGLWHDVVTARKERRMVAEASAILIGFTQGTDSDILLMVANQVHGRLLALGDDTDAITYLERSVEAARRLGSEMTLQELLGDLGNVYVIAGRLRDSRRAYEEALAISIKASHFEGQVIHLSNLAILEATMGNTAEQARLLTRARTLALAGKMAGRYGTISIGLASVYLDLGDFNAAADSSREAISAAEEVDDQALRAHAGGMLAAALAALGDDRSARVAYQDALDAARRFDHPRFEVQALIGLSGVAARADKLDEALDLARQALTVCERAQLPAKMMRAFANLALLQVRLGSLDEATQNLGYAANVGGALRNEISHPDEGPGIQTELAHVYDELVLQLVQADQIEEAFSAAERGRAALLVRRLRSDSWGSMADARELSLVLERVAPTAVLASYYLAGSSLLIFIVRAGKPLALERRLLPPTLLEDAVENYRQEVTAGADAIGEAWLRLSQYITEPLAPYLDHTSVLVVAPHRGLHNLPIHALNVGRSRAIDQWPVAYVPSVSSFPYLFRPFRPHRIQRAVIGAHFTEEAQAVAGILRVSHEDIDEKVDVNRALEVLEEGEEVHVSAHGFFSPREPDYSGWILEPSEGLAAYLDLRSKPVWGRTFAQSQIIAEYASLADSCILSASDLTGRRLGTKLVVASACESGVIAVDPSDDPSGLVPALLGAGVGGVVATLWLVDAERTKMAMMHFYEALAQCDGWDSVPRALQRAIIALKSTDPHPFYWAPFIAIGGFRYKERM